MVYNVLRATAESRERRGEWDRFAGVRADKRARLSYRVVIAVRRTARASVVAARRDGCREMTGDRSQRKRRVTTTTTTTTASNCTRGHARARVWDTMENARARGGTAPQIGFEFSPFARAIIELFADQEDGILYFAFALSVRLSTVHNAHYRGVRPPPSLRRRRRHSRFRLPPFGIRLCAWFIYLFICSSTRFSLSLWNFNRKTVQNPPQYYDILICYI